MRVALADIWRHDRGRMAVMRSLTPDQFCRVVALHRAGVDLWSAVAKVRPPRRDWWRRYGW